MSLENRRFKQFKRIRNLYADDESFREIWDDYRTAGYALRYFRTNGQDGSVEDYSRMRLELASEVKQAIRRAHRRHTDLRRMFWWCRRRAGPKEDER